MVRINLRNEVLVVEMGEEPYDLCLTVLYIFLIRA
jgi:hypothetical protein